MELKSNSRSTISLAHIRSNRTFMELKFAFSDCKVLKAQRSNRTFMELKLGQFAISIGFISVLIVPLWN